jgi:hypothetical protein
MGAPVTSNLSAPPVAEDRPPLPGQSGNPLMPNGLPALQPHGVDLQKMFSEDIKDPIERIKRVENAVVEMRRDFDAVLPSIVCLVAVEQDMQDLTKQLGVLLQNEPQASSAATPSGAGVVSTPRLQPDVAVAAAPQSQQPQTVPLTAPLQPATGLPSVPTPPSTAPPKQPVTPVQTAALAPLPQSEPQPLTPANPPAPAANANAPPIPPPSPPPPPELVAPAPETKAPPATAPASAGTAVSGASTGAEKPGGLSIQDVRLGEHSDATRIVMDATGRASYHYDLDNEENLLVIELPGAAWKAASKQNFASSPLVKSYSTQAMDNGGTRVIVQLKKPTRVVYETTLAAGGGEPWRIVLDLKK